MRIDRRKFVGSVARASAIALLRAEGSWSREDPRNLTSLSLNEAASLVRKGEVSPVELTLACLARIEEFDGKINSFITITRELALKQAKEMEAEVKNGKWRGALHGVPIALKDNIDTAGVRTTSASGAYLARVPTADAHVVSGLKSAGAVLIGKLNMSECAWGGGGVHSYWGPVRNPWNREYESGGSSSGSAAAVAAGFCFGSLGTDSGGSIRIPAARCGVVGLKPTYGVVSNRGVMRDFDSMMHVGPLGRTVLDTAALLGVVSGPDPGWTTCGSGGEQDLMRAIQEEGRALRIAAPRVFVSEATHPEVKELFHKAFAIAGTISTATQEDVTIPDCSEMYGKVLHAELWANCRSIEDSSHLLQRYLRDTLSFIRKNPVSSADYVDARRFLEEARRGAMGLFSGGFDLLIMPTVPDPPLTIEERRERLAARVAGGFNRQSARYSPVTIFNILGLPAMSVPCGFTRAGLPVGLLIVARPNREADIFRFAYAYERKAKWHLQQPILH